MLHVRPVLLAVLALAGCARVATVPPAPEVLWPEPPAAPRARLVGIVPDPRPRPASFWRKALNVVVGLEGGRARRALERPFGVAVAGDGELVVADPDLGAVVRLRMDGRARAIECREHAWDAPMAVALAGDGALLVADAGAGAVVRVAPDGRCSDLGEGFERPTGVAASGDRVFVVDPPRHEIVVLSPSGVARFGARGDGPGQLSFPTAIAVTHDGTLLVVDALNFRIARFAPDGRWLGSFGRRGEGTGELSRPKGIAVDPAGRVYVSDAQRDVILVFASDGAFLWELGAGGEDSGRLAHPAGLAVTTGRLHVSDSHNHRIQVFELLGDRS